MGTLIALIVFSDPLMQLVNRWATQEEYSHGFLIPVVAGWLFGCVATNACEDPARVDRSDRSSSRDGYAPCRRNECNPDSFAGWFCGGACWFSTQLGRISLVRAAIVPILFLLFAIPMPYFIDYALSLQLQLVSSQLGAFFIRLFGIPVYPTGMSSI